MVIAPVVTFVVLPSLSARVNLTLEAMMKQKLSRAVVLYLAALGRRGGSSTSSQKVKAAKKNGKLGGRPKGGTMNEEIEAAEAVVYWRRSAGPRRRRGGTFACGHYRLGNTRENGRVYRLGFDGVRYCPARWDHKTRCAKCADEKASRT